MCTIQESNGDFSCDNKGKRFYVVGVDISYLAPKAHKIVNIALHGEYSPCVIFI
jgi:hypothetical protein